MTSFIQRIGPFFVSQQLRLVFRRFSYARIYPWVETKESRCLEYTTRTALSRNFPFHINIAPVPPTPITRDVMIVFDHSGSMSQQDSTHRTKFEVARDAVSLFVQLIRSGVGNRVGLVSFSTQASSPVDFALTNVDDTSKQTLIGAAPYAGGKVGALVPNGATSIGDGLEKARLQLPAGPPGSN